MTPEDFLETNGFSLRTLDRAALLAAFNREMEEGLAGRPSSLKMIPTYVSPEGELRRDVPVTVLDAGGTNLRAATVELAFVAHWSVVLPERSVRSVAYSFSVSTSGESERRVEDGSVPPFTSTPPAGPSTVTVGVVSVPPVRASVSRNSAAS